MSDVHYDVVAVADFDAKRERGEDDTMNALKELYGPVPSRTPLPGRPTVSGLFFTPDPLTGQETLGTMMSACFGNDLPAPALATASILYPLPVISPDAFGQEQPGRTADLMLLPFAYLPTKLWQRLPFESAPVYQTRLLAGMSTLGLISSEQPHFISPFALAGCDEPTVARQVELLEWFDRGRAGSCDVFQAIADRAHACWPGGYDPVAQTARAQQIERQAARGVLPLQVQTVIALSHSGRAEDRGRAHDIFDQLRAQYAAPQGSAAASVFPVSPVLDSEELTMWVQHHQSDPIAFFEWLIAHHYCEESARKAKEEWKTLMGEERVSQ